MIAPETFRLFWAIPLPQDVKTTLRSLQTRLRSHLPSGTWPNPENLHLTLAFLGNQKATDIPGMLHALESALAECHPFTLVTEALGSFPKPKHSRVLWLAVQENSQLDTLASKLRRTLEQLRIPFDEKPFKPHLTLARFRNPADVSGRLEDPESLRFEVRSMALYRSHLTPQGARYEALREVGFR